jgi:hypothetical protein
VLVFVWAELDFMKNKKDKAPENAQLQIRYDEKLGGWVVEGVSKGVKSKLRPFATKMDAENYCIQKLHQCPITILPQSTVYQQLPQTSVWTGAPWDRKFKDA